MKKRLISILLVCLMALALFPTCAYAAPTASLSGGGTLQPGSSLTLTLSISGDSIYGLSGKLTYSDNLSFTDYHCTASGWSMEVNGTRFGAYGSNSASGGILTVTFKVSSSAKAGDKYSAAFESIEVSDGEKDISLSNAAWSGEVASPPSGNCDLDLIMCTNGTLVPEFNKNVVYYTMTVPYEIEKLNLDYNRADKGQTVTISGNVLEVGENTVTFTVKAANGATKVYTLTVTRQPDPNYVPSSNARLRSLMLSGALLCPHFSPDVTEYIAYVPFQTQQITLLGTAQDEKAPEQTEMTVTLSASKDIPATEPTRDEQTGELSPVVTYAAEARSIEYTATAEDGSTMVYTVHVLRMPRYSGGIPQIHMTNESDILPQEEETAPTPVYALPKTVTLPVLGETSSLLLACIGGTLLLILMLLLGILIGNIGRNARSYEPEDTAEQDERFDTLLEKELSRPHKKAEVADEPSPAEPMPPASDTPKRKFIIEEVPLSKAPGSPTPADATPAAEPTAQLPLPEVFLQDEAATPQDAGKPTDPDDPSSMSLDELLRNIHNM